MPMQLSKIGIEEFRRVEIRVGRVVSAERLRGTDRLIKLQVDFGDRQMQALAGLGHLYQPEHFVGRQFAFVTNLEPKKVRGEVSECMVLAAVESEDSISPLMPEKTVKEGSPVY